MGIASPHIKEGLVGFRPPAAYYRAIEANEVLLATEDGAIIGFIHFHQLKKREKQIRIYAIAVHHYRLHEGVGTKLIKAFLFCHRGYIFTEIHPFNTISTRFFRKHGFGYSGKSKQHKGYVTDIHTLTTQRGVSNV